MNWPGWKLALARSVHNRFWKKTGEIMAFNPFEKKTLQTETQVNEEEVKPESLESLERSTEPIFKSIPQEPTGNLLDVIKKEISSGMDTPKNSILKQHGGLESNIPVNSPYWGMK